MKNIKDNNTSQRVPSLGRRDLMKMGVGASVAAVTQMLNAPRASAQARCAASPHWEPMAKGPTRRVAQAGYKNDANRVLGNGPMDNTSRQIVTYAHSFSESNLSDPLVDALGYVMVDAIGCIIAGFESEPARICARMARSNPGGALKSTVFGYGVTTSPELAGFAGSCMMRCNEFNDNGSLLPMRGAGSGHGHYSDIIPGILAVGEALHSSGPQVLAAITLGYELVGALQIADTSRGPWDRLYMGPATAVAVGKLLGLNEDQLANALSISLVPHIPMGVSHAAGPLSMWKGCHDAEAIRCAIFAALLAREGMTGPCAPFEGKKGVWDCVSGPFKELCLPASPDGRMLVQRMNFKRFPSEGMTEAILEVIPQIRAWTKGEDIASIQIEMISFMEIGDPAKWDPRNEETADHSMPYVIARALIDGEIYLDSFTREKFMAPAVRQLMAKITIRENPDLRGTRITVRSKMGGELTKEAVDPAPMSHEELNKKFDRICAYKSVTNEQRDRTRATWSNLRAVKDIGEPIRGIAHFGRPLPL